MKTYKELRMTQQEYAALLEVRKELAEGVLKHKPLDHPSEYTTEFNMSTSGEPIFGGRTGHICGTIGCIGGWMWIKLKQDLIATKPTDQGMIYDLTSNQFCNLRSYVKGSRPILGDLFFPPTEYHYDDITPKDAVQAIDNLLEYGEPKWEEILDV